MTHVTHYNISSFSAAERSERLNVLFKPLDHAGPLSKPGAPYLELSELCVCQESSCPGMAQMRNTGETGQIGVEGQRAQLQGQLWGRFC